jgi:hypothetical protein
LIVRPTFDDWAKRTFQPLCRSPFLLGPSQLLETISR